MSKPDPPTPPNPYVTAAAQTGTNVSTGVANAFLNNVNQTNYGGSLNYDVTGNYDWTDPSTGNKYSIPRFTATQTPTQNQRNIMDNTQASQFNLSQVGRDQSYRIGNLLNTTFDPINMPWVPQGGNASNLANVGQAATSYDTGGQIQTGLGGYGQQQSTFGNTQQGPQYGFGDAGDITRSYGPEDNFSADRLRVEDSLNQRLNPQLAKDRTAIEQRLADQGIRYGSQAYTSAMDDWNRQANDQRLAVTAQGGQEQARMNDMAAKQAGFQNAAQLQAYQEAQGRGQFANTAQQQDYLQQQGRGEFANQAQMQNYQQMLGAGSFANAAQAQQNSQNAAQAGFGNAGLAQQLAQQQSVFNASNSARNQALQEQYAQRNQPMNEISALMSGSQVSQTPWLNTPNSQIATTDIGGLINQNFAQQQQNYQTANANWQATMGGLLGLGGKLAMMSDERVKENIVPMGTVFAAGSDGRRKQLPISEWSYKGDPARHVGPMAQDVERIDKSAVTTRGGIKHIYPDKVMGSILRAA